MDASEHGQLGRISGALFTLSSPESPGILILSVGDLDYVNFSFLRHNEFNSAGQCVGLLFACTVPKIDGVLTHLKAFIQQIMAKTGCGATLRLGQDWKIEKHNQPHDTVTAEHGSDLRTR